jgi:hypothetical protein
MEGRAKTITPEGGEFAASSNRVRVQFRAGAISKSMKVSVNEIEDAARLPIPVRLVQMVFQDF